MGKGRSVFPQPETVSLSHGRGGLTRHTKTRNKRGFPRFPRHGRSTRELRPPPPPLRPRPRSACTPGPGVVKAPPEPTRKQTPQQVKAGVAARAPAPGGERVARVGPRPCHVSVTAGRSGNGGVCGARWLLPLWLYGTLSVLSVSEKRDDLSAGIAEKASRKRWLPRSFQVSLLTEQGTQSPRWRLPLLRRQPEKWERGCVRGVGRGGGPAPPPAHAAGGTGFACRGFVCRWNDGGFPSGLLAHALPGPQLELNDTQMWRAQSFFQVPDLHILLSPGPPQVAIPQGSQTQHFQSMTVLSSFLIQNPSTACLLCHMYVSAKVNTKGK
ncbi:uncharacterized protein LOC121496205 isoform X3 [Vulpes lagopus]|uniref:uncharacterized protein LOC121496205 isoform X3 n=1 Tax=Vulpes lagopus TaxID=494514 RepID=UPI001BC9C861|nr:uncharacterized protein LOC121496205 isoform X3 [Vulpes lagopus]